MERDSIARKAHRKPRTLQTDQGSSMQFGVVDHRDRLATCGVSRSHGNNFEGAILPRFHVAPANHDQRRIIAAQHAMEKSRSGELGCSLSQLSLAWCASNPHVSSVITGASRVDQVHENLGALDVVDQLSDEVLARIERAMGD